MLVASCEAPDDYEQRNDASKAVAADFIDESNKVLRDRGEVPSRLGAKDDVNHNAECDQDKSEVDDVLGPVSDLLNRVHVLISRQVWCGHPAKL